MNTVVKMMNLVKILTPATATGLELFVMCVRIILQNHFFLNIFSHRKMSHMANCYTLHKLCCWLWLGANGNRAHKENCNLLTQENLSMYQRNTTKECKFNAEFTKI